MYKWWFFWSVRLNWQDQEFLPITINQSKEQVIFSSYQVIEDSLLDNTSNKENLKTASGLFDFMYNDREILDNLRDWDLRSFYLFHGVFKENMKQFTK